MLHCAVSTACGRFPANELKKSIWLRLAHFHKLVARALGIVVQAELSKHDASVTHCSPVSSVTNMLLSFSCSLNAAEAASHPVPSGVRPMRMISEQRCQCAHHDMQA